jgi:hypothetical protein
VNLSGACIILKLFGSVDGESKLKKLERLNMSMLKRNSMKLGPNKT